LTTAGGRRIISGVPFLKLRPARGP
jgi:hypothetical protein